MSQFFGNLFSSDFMPHGYCYLWDPQIVWLHAVSDGLIALSYYLIPLMLLYFVRKRKDLPFHWVFVMFGVFILSCGTTHVMEIWTLWHGTYRLAGVIKAITAGASVATAAMLVPLIPQALALSSPEQLREANQLLGSEIRQRRIVEEALLKAHEELESKVQQRTAELARANEDLLGEIAQRQRTQEALAKSQADLAHVTRVTTMGEIVASIAHEVNQPLTAVVMNANAGVRWLRGDSPNLQEARDALGRIIKEGNRASEVIKEIRALVRKAPSQRGSVQVNDLIQETLGLVRREMAAHRVQYRTDLAPDLPAVVGDRVQLQQVLLNLIINGIEAMDATGDRPRELRISSQIHDDDGGVLIAVKDSGAGLAPDPLDRIFDAFVSTKPEGMGMGLSIGRSIIIAHGGRLWAAANSDHGATFQFTVPIAEAAA